MPKFVALLRGINVGGKHRLPMKDLVRVLEGEGCTGVRTYIQSGNAIFEHAGKAKELQGRLAQAIEAEFGFAVPVVIRGAAQWRKLAGAHPFLAEGVDPAQIAVGFLSAKPTAQAARSLDPERSPGDRLQLSGSELYLHFPNGIARTKLTSAYLDRCLGVTCTVRNWKTVSKLQQLLED